MKNLVNLFHCYYSIENDDNKEFYDICRDDADVQYGFLLNKNNESITTKKFQEHNYKSMLTENQDIFMRKKYYPPIYFSLIKFELINQVLKNMNISTDFEIQDLFDIFSTIALRMDLYIKQKNDF